MRLATLVVVTLLLPPAPTHAQSDTTRVVVSGTVVDTLREAIEGVEVSAAGVGASTTTSRDGAFRLLVPPGVPIVLLLRRPGYRAQLVRVSESWSGIVMLTPGAYVLPEVAVNARWAKPSRYADTRLYDGFFERQRKGFGLFITREDIEARTPLYTADLLQAKPGIKAQVSPAGVGSMIFFARCNERRLGNQSAVTPKITVYIDGVKQFPEFGSPFNGELLDRVNVRDIEMMEIFRGPGELPPEFNDGNCGAIAIWTKRGRND